MVKIFGGMFFINKLCFGLCDVILFVLIGIIFGVIYFVGDFVYNVVILVLMLIGLGVVGNDFIMGLWCMVGLLVGFMFKCLGFVFLGEFFGVVGEMFLGG